MGADLLPWKELWEQICNFVSVLPYDGPAPMEPPWEQICSHSSLHGSRSAPIGSHGFDLGVNLGVTLGLTLELTLALPWHQFPMDFLMFSFRSACQSMPQG